MECRHLPRGTAEDYFAIGFSNYTAEAARLLTISLHARNANWVEALI